VQDEWDEAAHQALRTRVAAEQIKLWEDPLIAIQQRDRSTGQGREYLQPSGKDMPGSPAPFSTTKSPLLK